MTLNLTEDQLEELKETFAIYDLNGDGKISCKELSTVMRSFGLYPSEADVINYLKGVDKDKDGALNFEEFAAIMVGRVVKPLDTEQDIIEAFRVFDVEDKGFITAHELRQIMQSSGEKLTEEEMKLMIEVADHDRDGVINYKDFVKIMTTNQ